MKIGNNTARRRTVAASAFFAKVAVAAAVTIVMVEGLLRVLPFVVGEPLKSMIQEAARIPYSNVRTAPGGVAITLPKVDRADVLVLGDSFPFGTYEKTESIFPRLIAKSTGLTIVNLAVGSQSPPQYNRMLEVGARYHPRMVLYCIFANDFLYDANFVPQSISSDNTYRSLSGDDELFREDLGFTDSLKRSMRSLGNLSLSYQLLKILAQPHTRFSTIPWKQGKNFFMLPERHYWDEQVGWENARVKRGVEINHLLVRQAFDFAHSALAAQFFVVLQPSKEMVYGPLLQERQSRVYDGSQYATYQELERRLEQSGMPYWDLTPYLRVEAERGIALYHSIDGHFNEEGHRQTAAILSPLINNALR